MQVDINKQSFSRMIEEFVFKHRGIEYLEAIIEVCEKHKIDLRDCKKLLSKEIIEKLEVEVVSKNLLQGGNNSYTLPI